MNSNLKIKESLYVLKGTQDEYIFISTATRRIRRFQVDSLVKDIINYLNNEISESVLIEDLSLNYPLSSIESCIGALEQEGIIRRYNSNYNGNKFSRQLLFLDELTKSEEETYSLQKKIEESKIAVFGIGGIGTWIVNGLGQIGVGEIRIVDPDIIEESNLNRQLYFDSRDLGRYKVEVLKEKLVDLNLIPFKRTISNQENLEDIIFGCDFLVNCADFPSVVETTQIIDNYASKYNISYCVAGGYNMHLGMIGPIIVPNLTRTFDDFIEYQKANDPLKNFEKIKDMTHTGNLGPIAGAISNIQVMEIFKFITGKGKLNLNRFAEVDFMDLKVEWREF